MQKLDSVYTFAYGVLLLRPGALLSPRKIRINFNCAAVFPVYYNYGCYSGQRNARLGQDDAL